MTRIIMALCIGIAIGFFAPRQLNVVSHAASGGRFQQFAGSWIWHSGAITVDQSGHGRVSFRTYQNCSNSVVTDCDYFDSHSNIWGGGFTVFYLWKVQGNKAYGSVTNSGYSYQVSTTVTLVRNGNDTLSFYSIGPDSAETGCGTHAPAGYCGG